MDRTSTGLTTQHHGRTHGRERGHPRKLQPYGSYGGIHFVGWLQLNVVTASASGSVDGRVRGHDEKGSFYSDRATKVTA